MLMLLLLVLLLLLLCCCCCCCVAAAAAAIIGTINPGLQYAYLCEPEPSRVFRSLSRR
jgi:hypothetical protein